jgi:hypothetical protein
MVATDGVRRLGHLGRKTSTTSLQAALSPGTSIAGGCVDRVAAVNRSTPSSTASASTR